MRAILSSSVRPRIGRSISVSSHNTNALVRKTNLSAARRKLTFCDAFTILLTPVLTAAFVADITHKDSRRQEWDKKIAQIQAETEVLRGREILSWSSLQLSSVTAGLVQQRRAYSTSAAAIHACQNDADSISGAVDDKSATWSTFVSASEPTHTDSTHAAASPDYEKCVAVKVALDLLLHWRTGRHTRSRWAQRWAQIDVVDTTLGRESLETLVDRLAQINEAINGLRDESRSSETKQTHDTQERERLDRAITMLTWRCRVGKIGMPDLLYGYAQAVMTSPIGPSLITYRRLVETLSNLDAHAASYLAMSCYTNTTHILDDETVWSIIYMYGKLNDSVKLNSMLWDLAGPQNLYRTRTPWEIVFVGEIGIPVPTNRVPKVLDVLVRSALQLQQPHKARAWATVLLQHDHAASRATRVINNFLVYCVQHLDWMTGQFWLNLAVSWAAFAAHNFPSIWKVMVSRQLELCVACEQPEMYNQVLKAAVTAGIEPPVVDQTRPERLTPRTQDIRIDWIAQMSKTSARDRGSNEASINSTLNAAKIFQMEMAKTNPSVQDFIGVIDPEKLPLLKKIGNDVDYEDKSSAIQFPHTSTNFSSMILSGDEELSEHAPDVPQQTKTSNARLKGQVQLLYEKQKSLQNQLKQEQDKNTALLQSHEKKLRMLSAENEELRRRKQKFPNYSLSAID